jgi:hypothetical protein
MPQTPIAANAVVGRVAPSPPIFIRSLGPCPVCGFELVLNYWPSEGMKRDHDLPKARFPTLESALLFLRNHP